MSIQDPNLKENLASTPLPESVATYGALALLAAHCPLHKTYYAGLLNRIFLPAIEHASVRIFRTAQNQPCAALIWARLSDAVATRLVHENQPPKANEWNSGPNLWFLDVIAPFGHGLSIARHLARNPPEDAFSFARIDAAGKIRKVVRVEPGGRTNRAFQTTFLDTAERP